MASAADYGVLCASLSLPLSAETLTLNACEHPVTPSPSWHRILSDGGDTAICDSGLPQLMIK